MGGAALGLAWWRMVHEAASCSVVLAYELDIAHSREKVVMRGPYGAYGPRAASLIVGSSVGFVRCTT